MGLEGKSKSRVISAAMREDRCAYAVEQQSGTSVKHRVESGSDDPQADEDEADGGMASVATVAYKLLNRHFPKQPNLGLAIKQIEQVLDSRTVVILRRLHNNTGATRHGAEAQRELEIPDSFIDDMWQQCVEATTSLAKRIRGLENRTGLVRGGELQ